MTKLRIPTRFGDFHARFSTLGLAGIEFPASTAIKAAKRRSAPAKTSSPEIAHWAKVTTSAVAALLDGRIPKSSPPIDLSAGTDFQRSVWEALATIPAGETRSYTEIARRIGRSGAARAVGQACGANPVPLLIPCHRVLAADKKIGGFSGGLGWKRKLLKTEGVSID